jgi:hypothetical protein
MDPVAGSRNRRRRFGGRSRSNELRHLIQTPDEVDDVLRRPATTALNCLQHLLLLSCVVQTSDERRAQQLILHTLACGQRTECAMHGSLAQTGQELSDRLVGLLAQREELRAFSDCEALTRLQVREENPLHVRKAELLNIGGSSQMRQFLQCRQTACCQKIVSDLSSRSITFLSGLNVRPLFSPSAGLKRLKPSDGTIWLGQIQFLYS